MSGRKGVIFFFFFEAVPIPPLRTPLPLFHCCQAGNGQSEANVFLPVGKYQTGCLVEE